MKYCTNCGSVLNDETKFCAGCGEKASLPSEKGKKPSKKKSDTNNMEKGVVKSLKKETSNYVKSKIKNTISSNPDISKSIKKSSTLQDVFQSNPTNKIDSNSNPAKKLMIYYFLLNIPLYFINTSDDEILGILFFSVILLISYFIRIKKEKPFNIILKIIMGLQLLLMFASVMINLENLFSSIASVIAVITLIALIYVTGKLLIKGNKNI